MKGFLKYTLATITGIFVSGIVLSLIFFGLISAIVSMTEDKVVDVKPNSILHLKLNKPITERGSENPFEEFDFANMQPIYKIGLNDLLKNIEKAGKDDNISGIFLDLSHIPAGISTIEEIRQALLKFKESGKFIYTYAEYFSQGAYYLATASDKITMHPEGGFPFKGLSAEMIFFKKLFDKFGVNTKIFKGRDNIYKSASEQFYLNELSPENEEQMQVLLDDLWSKIIQNISVSRNIPIHKLQDIANELLIDVPESAIEYNLIDELKYRDQVIDDLKELSQTTGANKPEFITLAKYKHSPKVESDKGPKGLARKNIAVIYAEGAIVSGKGDNRTIGSEKISAAIKKAREDKNVKAIVLRVNSPGGSALASDVIWRETVLAKKEKPFIVSMGNLAASGGYYISCAADTIVCGAQTITGSIGVIGMLPNIENLMKDHLYLNVDRVKTNKYADLGSITREMTDYEYGKINNAVQKIYDTFLQHVSKGRNMDVEDVEKLAKGRVWSGEKALELGLIDVIGGLDKAIEIAAEKAGLEYYRIKELPEEKQPFEQIMEDMFQQAVVKIMENNLGGSYKYVDHLNEITKFETMQTRLPYNIQIDF